MVRASCLLGCCVFAAILLTVPTNAFPSASNYYRDETQYEPEEIMDMLNQLNHLLQLERKLETNPFRLRTPNPTYKEDITSDKRNLDLGLNRGYSGAIQAKHLLGLAAAKYIGGPGRRRRDVN